MVSTTEEIVRFRDDFSAFLGDGGRHNRSYSDRRQQQNTQNQPETRCWFLLSTPSRNSWGNKKRPIEERDALFYGALSGESYIMEDSGRECFTEGMQQADAVVLLEPPLGVRKRRILLRWIKQNLGIERCIYRPNRDMLKAMYKWMGNYESGKDGVKARVLQFAEKVVVLRTGREIEAYLRQLAD